MDGALHYVRLDDVKIQYGENCDCSAHVDWHSHRNLANPMLYVHINDQRASEACRESLMTAFG